MSAEAEAYVWRCSPFAGVAFAVHLAIADVVNDAYGFEFWMSQGRLAAKARTTRQTVNKTLALMCRPDDCPDAELDDPPPCTCEHRLLDELEAKSRDRKRYQFRMPALPIAWDPGGMSAVATRSKGVTRGDTGVSSQATAGVTTGDSQVSPQATPRELKEERNQLEGSTGGDGTLGLDIEQPPAHPAVAQGRDTATAVWDARKAAGQPVPAQPFIAVAKIATTLIEAGHQPDAVTAAMLACPTISTRWVEAELARRRPARGARAAVESDRSGPSGKVKL